MDRIVRISKGCEYAMTAMLWVSGAKSERPLHADEIAAGAGIPSRFARNILGHLANAGLLHPHRGATRGYTLARPASDVTLLDIIEAYDGPITKPWCFANRDKPCQPDHPCALHDMWIAMRDCTCQILSRKALADLHEGRAAEAEPHSAGRDTAPAKDNS